MNYATSNGSATAGSDYTSTSGTLTFAPGDASETITIPITDDATDEANETISVTLSGPSPSANLASSPMTTQVTIVDDDAAEDDARGARRASSSDEARRSLKKRLKYRYCCDQAMQRDLVASSSGTETFSARTRARLRARASRHPDDHSGQGGKEEAPERGEQERGEGAIDDHVHGRRPLPGALHGEPDAQVQARPLASSTLCRRSERPSPLLRRGSFSLGWSALLPPSPCPALCSELARQR